MARKRASMHEGPLAELFRATEAAQRRQQHEQQQLPTEPAAAPASAPEPSPSVSSLPMWIFVVASLICSCWMSVLTATKSTCVIPESIIRSTAFSPAPPTPTTRMTAR